MTEEEVTTNGERLWQQWCDWANGQGIRPPAGEAFEKARARVWEASEFVALSCARAPETLADLLASGDLDRALTPGDLDRSLTEALHELEAAAAADDERLKRALRRFRRRQMVRIVWRDLAGAAPLEETLEDLSELADVCIRRTLALLERWARAELGTPRDAEGQDQQLLVMGMGKLGARELNLSSDIDLIFAYPASGEVEGPRYLANEQFFARLARRLVQALDDRTVDGFVFRVDTRLRPFGDAGPLAMSFPAMEDYYQSQAREWERYAMIKARVVAGPAKAAEQLMTMLRPFTYRRYLDFGAIDALRSMKQLISQELKRKGMADNIKLGPGGIREIEFIGQAFQLIRGGRDPDLQIRPIRSVLRLLGEKSLMPEFAVRQLDQAYVFLRLVENRIQAWKDKQTHLLPEDAIGRRRLARAMGCGDWPAFIGRLDMHRRRVQGQFDSVFVEQGAEEPAQGPSLSALWLDELSGSQALEQLGAVGFQDPTTALERLAAFRDSVARRGLSSRGAQRLAQLMPLVLQVVAGSDAPDPALERVLRVLESVVRRTAYLAMLAEHPIILSQLAQLAGMSPWVTRQVAGHPLLLDELLDPRRLYAPLRRVDLGHELEALLEPLQPDDLEQQMERLRQFAQGNMLRVAAADLTGVIPLMVVSDYLTEIAEVTVDAVVDLAYRHLVRRHGHPAGASDDRSGFLVVGYGKLGGIELGYGSDLDLVFLHGSNSINAITDGERPISNDQFYMRLGQRIIHMLTTQTPSGQLYEVDMRLRPDGNKGMLVRSLASFASYQMDDAWTWEHQALVRARAVAGDRALFERFSGIRRETLCRDRDNESLSRDVREMREKMRANLDKTRDDRFDLKQGRGGIADIEFMVQYSVLRWAQRYPKLCDWTDNVRLLETLGRLELLTGSAAEELTDAYKDLRAAYHRGALQDGPMTIAADRFVTSRERVAAWWRALMEA
jgi:glutamate-ammonia-ligase adenylyltransferase